MRGVFVLALFLFSCSNLLTVQLTVRLSELDTELVEYSLDFTDLYSKASEVFEKENGYPLEEAIDEVAGTVRVNVADDPIYVDLTEDDSVKDYLQYKDKVKSAAVDFLVRIEESLDTVKTLLEALPYAEVYMAPETEVAGIYSRRFYVGRLINEDENIYFKYAYDGRHVMDDSIKALRFYVGLVFPFDVSEEIERLIEQNTEQVTVRVKVDATFYLEVEPLE